MNAKGKLCCFILAITMAVSIQPLQFVQAAETPERVSSSRGNRLTRICNLPLPFHNYLPIIFSQNEYIPTRDLQAPVASLSPIATISIGDVLTINGTIDDRQTGGSNILSAEYQIDGGAWAPMQAVDGCYEEAPLELTQATAAAIYTTGAHQVCIRGTDTEKNTSQSVCISVTVKAPEFFVTGGGWFWSDKGSLVSKPDIEGKANFGFVAKYFPENPHPQGSLEFNLRKNDLKFHSTSFDWYTINPSTKAIQLKGWGRLGTEEYYQFMLWATDSNPDLFRIRIWKASESGNQTTYDNLVEQAIAGGNIKIHEE